MGEHKGYRDEHTVIEGFKDSGWLTTKPITVTEEITKNHDDGTAWLVICNGMERYCNKKCSKDHFKQDLEFKVNDEIVTFDNQWPLVEAGGKGHNPEELGNWLPLKTNPEERYAGITDLMHLRSGQCLALKKVKPGDYVIKMRILNEAMTSWLTHIMVL